MYCEACEEERLGTAPSCAACGARLTRRERSTVEAELAHVQYLLAQLPRWGAERVPEAAREYLEGRYRRLERVLMTALFSQPEYTAATSALGEPPVGFVPPPDDGKLEPPVPPAVEDEAPGAVVIPFPVKPPAEEPIIDALPVEASPLPESPSEPVFDVPHAPTATEKVIEEASSWSKVWKPFLYESVGWFIGAFLILAGTFYFVAESWAGMSSQLRALVVFGLTAAYSAGFALWGRLFSRKESLASAGRILGLIGAAIAPLAGIALGPIAEESPVLFWPLGVGWAVGAMLLVRAPARTFQAGLGRHLEGAMLLTALMMGAAPLLARGGASMVWLDAVPTVLFVVALRSRGEAPESREANAFALLAPVYLIGLFGVRLHLALAHVGMPPSLGTYAPFAAGLLGGALQLRALDQKRAADALSVGVVALQVACIAGSVLGTAPAFFLTTAVCAFTWWTLSHGAPKRAGWLYGTYAAGYLAYQSVGTLVPGPLLRLLEQVKQALGYETGGHLPLTYDAVYALPYVLGGLALAVRFLRQSERPGLDPERPAAAAEVLLRATAIASGLCAAASTLSADHRPALWTVPVVVLACTAAGLWLNRPYLTWTGALSSLFVPIFGVPMFGRDVAMIAAAVLALGFAGLSVALLRKEPHGRSVAAVSLTVFVAFLAWWPPFHVASGGALLLSAVAVGLLAWRRDSAPLTQWAAALLASAVPLLFLTFRPHLAPLSLAVAGLLLAVAADRVERLQPLRRLALTASFIAAGWQAGLQWASFAEVPVLLGPVLVLGTLCVAVGARRQPSLGKLGVLFLWPACLPAMGHFVAWPWVTPTVSAALFALMALGASAWVAVRGRSEGAPVYALASQVGALVAAVLSAFHADAGSTPLLICTLGALFSTRALHPWLSLPLTAVWALVLALPLDGAWTLAVPVGFSVLALSDELPTVRDLLFGPRRLGLAASLCALAASLAGLLAGPVTWQLGLAVALPLVWLRATRQPFFAAAPAVLVVGLLLRHPSASQALWVLPVLAVVVTRLLRHVPAFAKLLLGDEAEKRAAQVNLWLMGSVAAVAILAMATPGLASPQHLQAFVLAIFLGVTEPLEWRLVMAGVLAALVPEARPWASGLLLVIAFTADLLPAPTHALLGAKESPRSGSFAAVLGMALLAWATWYELPHVWAPVGVSAIGAAFCCLGAFARTQLRISRELHHAGWILALAGVALLKDLGHPAMPLCLALCMAAAWAVVVRAPAIEPVGWLATVAALHGALVYAGIAFPTGKPEAFILPYFATSSALVASVALLLPPSGARRTLGSLLAGVALVEVVLGLMWIDRQALREAWVSGLGLALLAVALVRAAVRDQDERPAYLAQACLVAGYLVIRWQGLGAESLDGADGLAALVAGALFSGLYVWIRREGQQHPALVRPVLVGAFALPIVGLAAVPGSQPLVSAALLVGNAAHFAALALHPAQRKAASVLSAIAFNAALLLSWRALEAVEPQYFVIPAGLSALALIRLFRAELSPIAEARLRAAAITAIYAASAWRPLMFPSSAGMLLCVLICVLGVGVGIALRIRSYVYLGTGFVVTTVVANLTRYGVRDHRLGALFLSALGLGVVGFMVLLSAKRADLLRRYHRVRELLEQWQA